MNKEYKKLIKDPFLNWLIVIAYATLIFAFSSIGGAELREVAPVIDVSDIILHFFEYFLLGIFIFRALFVSGCKKSAYWLAIIIASAYAITDEVHQLFILERVFSIKDIIVDIIGATAAQIGGLKRIFLK